MKYAVPPDAPWLIGECNPYQRPGEDPDHTYDLFPRPTNASGGRLCRLILEMSESTYLRSFTRRDLLEGKWSVPRARMAAEALWRESGTAPLVLLGAKVAAAFGLPYQPMTSIDHGSPVGIRRVVLLPHPSGLNRAWHVPGAYAQAGALVRALLPVTP